MRRLLALLAIGSWLFLAVPQFTFAATSEQQQALERVNYYRSLAGVPSYILNESLSQGAMAHANYYILNLGDPSLAGVGAHDEISGKSGFTGLKPWDRARYFGYPSINVAENMHYMGSPANTVDSWMDTVFHRFEVISPNMREMGYGIAASGVAKVDVLDVGSPSFAEDPSALVVYPAPDQIDVPLAFGGSEVPNPLPGAIYPVGYPITATFGGGSVQLSNAVLRNSRNEAVDSYVLQPSSSQYMLNRVALLAKQPLEMAEGYTVQVGGTVNGNPFTKTWSFSTRGGIAARVMSQNSQPLPGIRAEARNVAEPTSRFWHESTDPKGELKLVLPQGVYELRYSWMGGLLPGYSDQTQILEVKSGAITAAPTVIMSPRVASVSTPGQIYGRVISQKTRRAIRGTVIRINNSIVGVNRRGFFRFTLVSPGAYTIYYDAPGHKGQTQVVEVKAGQVTRPPATVMSR